MKRIINIISVRNVRRWVSRNPLSKREGIHIHTADVNTAGIIKSLIRGWSMSADNFLLVRKESKRKFVVYGGQVASYLDHPKASFPNLEAAMNFAAWYMREEIVEYGIRYEVKQ